MKSCDLSESTLAGGLGGSKQHQPRSNDSEERLRREVGKLKQRGLSALRISVASGRARLPQSHAPASFQSWGPTLRTTIASPSSVPSTSWSGWSVGRTALQGFVVPTALSKHSTDAERGEDLEDLLVEDRQTHLFAKHRTKRTRNATEGVTVSSAILTAFFPAQVIRRSLPFS